jgi:predicted MFS family arabinose efflux permease
MNMPFAGSLRHARFRRLWVGQAVSSIGDGIFTVALIGAVLQHHQPSGLGFVLAAESAGMVVLSLLGGAIADRMRRGRAMAMSDGVRMLAVLGFTLGAASGPLPLILLLTALMGAASAVFQPAFGALIPSLVPDESLAEANALRTTTTKVASIIGPGLGGLLLAFGGSRTAFLVDLGTFVVSILTLIGLNDPVPARGEPETVFRDARAGLIAVRERPWVMTIILQGTAQLLLVMGPAVVLLPILLKQHGEFGAYGIMAGLEAAGSVLGGLAASVWKPRRTGVVAVCALSLLGLQLLSLLLGLPLYVLGVTVLATGFGYSLFGVLWMSALQRSFSDDLLGRVLSVEMLGTFALAPVGLAVTPLAISVMGTKLVLVAALVALAASTVVPLFQREVRAFASSDSGADEAVAVPSGRPRDR